MTEVNIYKLRLLSVKSVAAFQVAELFEALFVWGSLTIFARLGI